MSAPIDFWFDFSSPYGFVDGEPFWGLDRFDQIDRWLASGGF